MSLVSIKKTHVIDFLFMALSKALNQRFLSPRQFQLKILIAPNGVAQQPPPYSNCLPWACLRLLFLHPVVIASCQWKYHLVFHPLALVVSVAWFGGPSLFHVPCFRPTELSIEERAELLTLVCTPDMFGSVWVPENPRFPFVKCLTLESRCWRTIFHVLISFAHSPKISIQAP